jgi:hypothetical protein
MISLQWTQSFYDLDSHFFYTELNYFCYSAHPFFDCYSAQLFLIDTIFSHFLITTVLSHFFIATILSYLFITTMLIYFWLLQCYSMSGGRLGQGRCTCGRRLTARLLTRVGPSRMRGVMQDRAMQARRTASSRTGGVHAGKRVSGVPGSISLIDGWV